LTWDKTETTQVLDGIKVSERKKKRKEAPLGTTIQYCQGFRNQDITQSKDPTTEIGSVKCRNTSE